MVVCPQNSLIHRGTQKNDSGQLFPASHLCGMDCQDLLEESGQDGEGGAMRQEAGLCPGCGLGQVPSPLWASVSSSVKWVHPFPAARVTTPHKLSGLKQHTFIILHSGGSGVHRGLPRLWLTCQQCCVLPEAPEGENPLPAFPAYWRAPAFLGSRPLPLSTASDGLSHSESPTLALLSPLHREASL